MKDHVKARAGAHRRARRRRATGRTSTAPSSSSPSCRRESLLSAALSADPSLLDYSFGKRVALASPVNLWAVLKTVAYTWTQQALTDDARRLFDL